MEDEKSDETFKKIGLAVFPRGKTRRNRVSIYCDAKQGETGFPFLCGAKQGDTGFSFFCEARQGETRVYICGIRFQFSVG